MSKISDLVAAINRLAAAIEQQNTLGRRAAPDERAGRTPISAPGAPITAATAYRLPAPKGYVCAAGCGHHIGGHGEAGCNAWLADSSVCPCPAPFGRLLPPEVVPDDPSSLLGGESRG